MVLTQFVWHRKELLRSNGEKLRRVGRGVAAQKRSASLLQSTTQSLKSPLHHPLPALRLIPGAQGWGPVGVAIEKIELVGELVDNQVMARGGVARFGQHGFPREENRAVINGAAKSKASAFLPGFGRHFEGGWKQDNGQNTTEVVMV